MQTQHSSLGYVYLQDIYKLFFLVLKLILLGKRDQIKIEDLEFFEGINVK